MGKKATVDRKTFRGRIAGGLLRGVLMSTQWQKKGCPVCRALWESGQHPPELAMSIVLHSRLHRCSSCAAFWEQSERYADIISEQQARALYPEAFK
jgi:hypothetical protein